jgi:hypothetical protein
MACAAAERAERSMRGVRALDWKRGSAPLALLLCLTAGCSRSAPESRFPTADAALSRMHEAQRCSRGVSADAKLEYFGPEGRVRGNVLYLTSVPDRVRLDVWSPFGATISSLTSDGSRFALLDVRAKTFVHGPANACNLALFTQVPLPPHALVDVLRGEAPVLVHDASGASIAWEGGRYVVRIESKHGAVETIELLPHDADFARPWQEQRVRVLSVQVEQFGVLLYRIELEGHARVVTAPELKDPDGIEPPVPPSGPACQAELPRSVRIEVPNAGHDLSLVSRETFHNPPLREGTFTQPQPGGVRVRYSPCGG